MTGIVFIKREKLLERLFRKIKLKLFHRHVAASFGIVTTPKILKGEPSVAIRFAPFSDVNLISDILAHETVHETLFRNLGNEVSNKLDRILGTIDLKSYLKRRDEVFDI